MSDTRFTKSRIADSLRLGRAFRLVWRGSPKWAVASLATLIVQALLPLVVLYITKLIVDEVSSGIAEPGRLRHVFVLLGIAVAVNVVLALCRSIARLINEAQSEIVTDYAHSIIHAKSTRIDLEYYENPDYHDTLHRALGEAVFRPARIVEQLTQLGQSIVSLVGVSVMLFAFHWAIPLLLVAAGLPGFIVRVRYAREVYEWDRQVTETRRRAHYFNSVLTEDTYAKEIRLFDLAEHFVRLYKDLRSKLRYARLQLATKHLYSEFTAELGAILTLFASYAYVIREAALGLISIGSLVLFFQAFQRGLGSLQQTMRLLSNLYEYNLFLSSLDEFVNLKPILVESKQPKSVPRPMQAGVVFDDVTFRYSGGSRNALENVRLRVGPGEVVALVGENGSGKSTLIKLLCRLYDPAEGRITVDGTDIREFASASLRREIGIIFQDYAHYDMTAYDNIWLGNTCMERNEDAVVAAARHSGADAVIRRLKHGYDTVLGKEFKGGEELSIGQWQKLALARAFLRDAQMIVLDEPTSAMDPAAEYEFFENFRRLTSGRSAIIISHRFSTVKMADRIYVMQHGRIIESGTHDQLVDNGQVYARLFEKQAQYYR